MRGILDGKRLLVTGIASVDSIAFATAAAAMREGAEVLATALQRDLDRAREACADLPVPLEPIPVDMTDPADLGSLVQAVATRTSHSTARSTPWRSRPAPR